jgi:hypothetical protein
MAESKFDLQKLKIASPCYERWENMKGDARIRHCASCKLNVYNLREMTAAEVDELIERNSGRLCLRIYKRWDGTVLTRDCPVGVSRARVRMAAAMATAAAFMVVLVTPLLLRLGSKEAASLEGFTFEERIDMLRYQAYEWPVIGAVLEKIYPQPTATVGAVIRTP